MKLDLAMRPKDCRAVDWLILQSLAASGGDLERAVAETGQSLAAVRMAAFQWRAVWQRAKP